jgi:hypothetical protein
VTVGYDSYSSFISHSMEFVGLISESIFPSRWYDSKSFLLKITFAITEESVRTLASVHSIVLFLFNGDSQMIAGVP